VIAPTMLYENHSTAELVAAMKSGQIRALRVFPGTLRHKMCHLEPLIEKVAPHNPVIFVSVPETEEQDLLAFAERFKRTPIVCMHGMWPHIFNYSLLNVMRRCPNVLIDNSWLHCSGVVEMVVRDFGVNRVVFATGYKAHNGASIAHLQCAEISPAQRESISHGNLDRLLGMKTTPMPRAMPGADSCLWERFRRGGALGIEIIDAHGHLGSEGLWAVTERDVAEQIPVAIRRMDALGIRTMFCSGQDALFSDPVAGNRKLEALAGKHGDRFRGYLTFNPFYAKQMTPLLDEFFARPFFAGFKSICDYWGTPVTDERFRPAYQYAHEHRLPFLIHTWQGGCNSPAMMKDLVREFPEAIFVLGHSGGGDQGRREAEELTLTNPNVIMEWCGSFCSHILWEETLAKVRTEQVIFGSDGIYHDFAWELGRLLSVAVPDETLRPILGDNMRRILSLRR
jgi:uncharacterized protein